jgi:chromate transport protein ChrA
MSSFLSNPPPQTSAPQLGALVTLFAKVGVTAFGGKVPIHVLPACLRHSWLTDSECLEAMNWCECLPGNNATNLSAYLGYRFQRAMGALLATLAMVLPGATIILLVSKLLAEVPQQVAQAVLTSVTAVGVGLLLELTWKLARPALVDHIQSVAAITTFVLVGIFGVPIPLAVVVITPAVWYLSSKSKRNKQ